jgi:hypothetical protein
MNPLWEPLEIPSGKSIITDMIRAIRFHIEKIKKYSNLIAAYRRREEYKTNVWDTEEKRLKYVDTVAENLEINFTSTTYSSGFLAFLVCSHPIDFYMRRRMSLPLCVPPMTIEEEELEDSLDHNAKGVDEGGPSTAGRSSFVSIFFEYKIVSIFFVVALTASKSTREANRDQASSIAGTASATVSAKPGKTKKRSRKEILLSDDESTTGEKTLTIQMQHTISKSSTSEGGNSIMEAVKSLNEELRSRKDLIIQLQELDDPTYTAEILTNKKRIIEVGASYIPFNVFLLVNYLNTSRYPVR